MEPRGLYRERNGWGNQHSARVKYDEHQELEAMKRSSRASGKPVKARRRKALKPKAHSTPKAIPRRGSAPAGQTEVAQLTRERKDR